MNSAIPATLRMYQNWVVWKYITKDGRPTKIPYDVKTGKGAKSNDSSTWVSYEDAVKAADVLNGSDYEGIGFMLHGTNFIGIDFDNAISDKGIVDPYALSILKILGNPYTEKSPSGRGLHAFVDCDHLPEGGRKMSQGHAGIEIYHGREGGRYFTITGDHVGGETVPHIEDIGLPYLLITQNKDKKFRALWLGDTSFFDGDESSADCALMVRLAGLTNSDPVKMEKYFSVSALGQREKWTQRDDYRQRTIKYAIDHARKTEPGAQEAPEAPETIEFHSPALPDPSGEYVIAPVSGQEDGWFPLGDVSLIGGASGTGKTTIIFEMLHKQKQKFPFLDHRTFGYGFHVLAYDRGKNAFKRTMRRLNLRDTDIPMNPLPLAFGTAACQGIINEIEKLNPVPQVVFIEGLDMLIDDANKKSVVSPFMRHLQSIAEHFHLALVCSVGAPKTKRGEDYAAKRDKLSGSEAWGRNCETVAILEFSEEDDGTSPRRELTVLPRNAPAEKFSLQFEGGRLVPVAAVPDEEKAAGGRPSDKMQSALQFLRTSLQSGAVGSKELIRRAHEFENISRSTLYDAARFLHVVMDGKIAGQSCWALPEVNATIETVMSESGKLEKSLFGNEHHLDENFDSQESTIVSGLEDK